MEKKEVKMEVEKDLDMPIGKEATMDMGAQFMSLQRDYETLMRKYEDVVNRFNQLASSNMLTFVKLMIEYINTPNLNNKYADGVQKIVYDFIEGEVKK